MDIEDLMTSKEFDVIIIGAGVIGANVARELSKFENLVVLILEKELDVTQGASKANSGIVHGGYDTKHGSTKSQLEFDGNQLFDSLCSDLSVPFKRVGSLVLSFTDRDDEELERLLENGMKNGVPNLEIWDRDQIISAEPHISVGVRRALYCPHAGITNPYLFTIANFELAIANGVQLKLGTQVIGVSKVRPSHFEVLTQDTLTNKQYKFLAKKVINCAGVYSDTILKDPGFQIKPRRGEYFLLSREQGHMASRVIFQAPTPRWGKGVLVSPTVDGNLLIGPSAADFLDRSDKSTSFQELGYVAWAARRSVPHIDTRLSIRSFAGIRAKSSTGDFVINNSDGFVNVAGIDSPGLTASPAIAKRVVKLLELVQPLKSNWIAKRAPYHSKSSLRPKHEMRFEHPDPELNIVCRCEEVTESTIIDCLHSGIPLHCTDSVKWRTRAGMGPCQGVRCRPLVCEIMAKELSLSDPEKVPKVVPGQHTPKRLVKTELGRL